LFVLRHILDEPTAGGADAERICSMAFGPGLTVETALFTKLGSPLREAPPAWTGGAAGDAGTTQPESALA